MEAAKGTVLVVDDEAGVRELAVALLKRYGFQVLAARDGREAVDVFREHQGEIEAVLLDVMMPRMNGLEAFRELANIDPEVPVVLMSGYVDPQVVGRLPAEGLAGFLTKPFRFSTLVEQIEQAIGARRESS